MVRNVIVTGGSRGLGLAIARRLAVADTRVIVLARGTSDALDAACRQATTTGGEIVFHAADLRQTRAIPSLVRTLRQTYGVPYALVNNAGVGIGGVLGLMRDTAIEELIAVNTLAPIVMAKYVSRAMLTQGAGRIVNITSITAANGYRALSVYSATKASLVGFTRSLARELGPAGITVNAVAPGFLETDMTAAMQAAAQEESRQRSALRRLAQPDDVARSVEFLLGDGGRNITGTIITVDAGRTT